MDGNGPQPRLVVSSASGPSIARVLEQIVAEVPRQESVQLVDLHPLPTADPQGLTTFYVVIAATALGFVTMFQLRANIDEISLCGWLGLVAALAVVGGGLLAVVSDPALGALHGSFVEIWGLLSAQCAIAALFNSTMLVLIGKWAILPTWGLFIVLGNASSGGAVASALLPTPYAWLSRLLPTGATVSGLHTAVYFPHHQHLEPFVVLGVWLAVCAAALICSSRLRHKTPVD